MGQSGKSGETRKCLRELGNEGVTKTGHSLIHKLTYGKLAVMLGGDLSTQSRNILLKAHTSVKQTASSLEQKVAKLEAMGAALGPRDEKVLGLGSHSDGTPDDGQACDECPSQRAHQKTR